MNLREQLEKEITDKVMTKLASERVELGLIDDAKDQNEKTRKINTNLFNAGKKFLDAKNSLDGFIKEAQNIYNKGVSVDEKIGKAAKDLGLNISDVKEAKQLNSNLSQLEKILNDVEKLRKR